MNDKDEGNDGTPQTPDELCFMLSRLTSELTELSEGLKNGAVPYHAAVAAVRTQLTWVLQLLPETEPGEDEEPASE